MFQISLYRERRKGKCVTHQVTAKHKENINIKELFVSLPEQS
jgi:hypothetical protein